MKHLIWKLTKILDFVAQNFVQNRSCCCDVINWPCMSHPAEVKAFLSAIWVKFHGGLQYRWVQHFVPKVADIYTLLHKSLTSVYFCLHTSVCFMLTDTIVRLKWAVAICFLHHALKAFINIVQVNLSCMSLHVIRISVRV